MEWTLRRTRAALVLLQPLPKHLRTMVRRSPSMMVTAVQNQGPLVRAATSCRTSKSFPTRNHCAGAASIPPVAPPHRARTNMHHDHQEFCRCHAFASGVGAHAYGTSTPWGATLQNYTCWHQRHEQSYKAALQNGFLQHHEHCHRCGKIQRSNTMTNTHYSPYHCHLK